MTPARTERTEYRVVGERPDGRKWGDDAPGGWTNLFAIKQQARELDKRNKNVRIQSRTVTATPWEDVADA